MPATILVVEDEPSIQELIALNLEQAGQRPVLADSAEQALERIQEELPDLVLLDWMLPGQSGLELARRLRGDARTKTLPIIMLTARGDEEDKLRGLETGADDYITKPFNFSEVLARIRAVLRTRELIHQIERREARIRITEEIASRVLSFAAGLRKPLSELAVEAAALEPECGNARPFVLRSRAETEKALEGLAALDSAVAALSAEAESLKKAETALPAIKTKLRSHGAQ